MPAYGRRRRVYCSNRCKQAAYRSRRDRPPVPVEREPEPEPIVAALALVCVECGVALVLDAARYVWTPDGGIRVTRLCWRCVGAVTDAGGFVLTIVN